MKVGGHDRRVDYERLGGSLVVAASIILAIRTARHPPQYETGTSNRDFEAEMEFAVKVAGQLLSIAVHRQPDLFAHKTVEWHVPDESDIVK